MIGVNFSTIIVQGSVEVNETGTLELAAAETRFRGDFTARTGCENWHAKYFKSRLLFEFLPPRLVFGTGRLIGSVRYI